MITNRFICALVAALSASSLHADEKAKPNTLTQKEIEEGWILLFDGETTFGWKVEGEVQVENSTLKLGGTKKSVLTTTAAFGPCKIEFEYDLDGAATHSLSGRPRAFPASPGTLRRRMQMSIEASSDCLFSGSHKEVGGGDAIVFSGARVPKGLPTVQPATSQISFAVNAESKLKLKSIKLKPIETNSLFNAKDLAGWKVFVDPKRNKSQWTVTREGWLNVKNGPGDLQTEKKYDDFILQFDCISNGKALNSGIFFRCMPDQYQNGYEAQIQNGFKDNDRTKPADFGTGAIYRRIAARKVVPNDNEWFTMTVLAHGKHIATWVNGYQTVDWTDDRKENDNPRNGYRAAAGHISIQGHDPTTDLSFRNIRIVELKEEKKKN